MGGKQNNQEGPLDHNRASTVVVVSPVLTSLHEPLPRQGPRDGGAAPPAPDGGPASRHAPASTDESFTLEEGREGWPEGSPGLRVVNKEFSETSERYSVRYLLPSYFRIPSF